MTDSPSGDRLKLNKTVECRLPDVGAASQSVGRPRSSVNHHSLLSADVIALLRHSAATNKRLQRSVLRVHCNGRWSVGRLTLGAACCGYECDHSLRMVFGLPATLCIQGTVELFT